MAVLPELADHHAGPATLLFGKVGDVCFQRIPVVHGVSLGTVVGGGIDAGHLVRVRTVSAKRMLQRIADFAYGCAQSNCLDRQVQQVARAIVCCRSNSRQCSCDKGWVAIFLDGFEAGDLPLAHRHVVNVTRFNRVFGLELVLVDAHNHVPARVDARLLLGRSRLDLELGPAAFHRMRHAAHGFDLFDDGPGGIGHVLGQFLHHVAAGPRVDHVGDVGLFLDDELGIARNTGRKLCRQRDGLVKTVGVQALGAAKHRRHGLDGGAHHVVVGVLLGQAPAAGLAVRAQHQALGRLGVKALHDAAPQQARRPHLGHLQVEVHADRPEKRQPSGKFIYIQAGADGGLDVLLAVRQREGQLQRLVGARLLHVVTRNRDRVELGHVARGVANDVTDDAHRGGWRVDVGVANHELLQDVVLDRPRQLVLRHTLLFRRHHVARQHRQHGAVHGHGHAHLVERNLVEQDLHVLDRVDRHPGLAHVTGHARVVAVVATVGGQVKGDADALPAAGQRLAVERIGFLGGRKAGVLADGPGPHRVHAGLGAAQVGLKARQRVGVGQIGCVGRGVQRLDRDAVRGEPVQRDELAARCRLGRGLGPGLEAWNLEFR